MTTKLTLSLEDKIIAKACKHEDYKLADEHWELLLPGEAIKILS